MGYLRMKLREEEGCKSCLKTITVKRQCNLGKVSKVKVRSKVGGCVIY